MTLPHPAHLTYPRRHGDARGCFTGNYNRDTSATLGSAATFVQDNHSLSAPAFTLRGLHFQAPPRGQDKLARCICGRAFDVAVDIRKYSPTYGQWGGTELPADEVIAAKMPERPWAAVITGRPILQSTRPYPYGPGRECYMEQARIMLTPEQV